MVPQEDKPYACVGNVGWSISVLQRIVDSIQMHLWTVNVADPLTLALSGTDRVCYERSWPCANSSIKSRMSSLSLGFYTISEWPTSGASTTA